MTKTRIGVLPYNRGTYSNTVTYGLDNRVTDANGDYYTSLKDDNLNHPLTDTEWWARNTYAKENKDAISAESARQSAESKRVTAENGRVSAESTRQSQESARQTAEQKRETTVNNYMEVIKKPIVSTSEATVNMDANKLYNITVGSALTLNINTATEEQLDQLPGVGPSTAKAIVDYRTQNGRFSSIEDIQEVSGIGESKYSKICGLICV